MNKCINEWKKLKIIYPRLPIINNFTLDYWGKSTVYFIFHFSCPVETEKIHQFFECLLVLYTCIPNRSRKGEDDIASTKDL